MKKTLRGVAALMLVGLVLALGIPALAQVTSISPEVYGRLMGAGPVPTVGTCGTAPAIAGNDTMGTITIGTGTPTACTVTFSRAFPVAPACYFNDLTTAGKTNAGTTYKVAPTTTAVVVTFQATVVDNDVVQYWCLSR